MADRVALQTAEISAPFGHSSFPAGSDRAVMDAGAIFGCGLGARVGPADWSAFPLGVSTTVATATRIAPGPAFA